MHKQKAGKSLLAGKNVLVTAAAGTGIGFALAKRCVEEDAKIAIADIHEKRLHKAAEALSEITGKPTPTFLCDVTDEPAVQRMVAGATEAMDGVDVLFNNAGLGGTQEVVNMSDEEWSRVIDISLTGTFRVTRAILPHMISRGSGCIVNNASVSGWRAQKGQSHYAAAKAGVMAFTRCAALEAAEHGIRINAVAPSLAMHPYLAKVTTEQMLEKLKEKEAFGRAADPAEIANVMIFLASDYSSYMTGEVISVSSQRA